MSWLKLFKTLGFQDSPKEPLTYLGLSVPNDVTYRLKNQGDDLYREYPERLRIVNSSLLKFKTDLTLIGVAIDLKKRTTASEKRTRPQIEILCEKTQSLIDVLVETPEIYPGQADLLFPQIAHLALDLSKIMSAQPQGPAQELKSLSEKFTAYHIFIKSGIFPRSSQLEKVHLKTLAEWKEKFRSEWEEKYE